MNLSSKIIHSVTMQRLAIAFVCSLLVSCGGSTTIAGIGGTGISYGTVTGFGSVILNGSRLDDSTASVTLDDNSPVSGSINHGGLKQGMVVKVSGDFSGNTGTANSIVYRDNLEGEVCTTQTVDGITTLRVLGQRVIQDATTIVENGPVTVGDIIEVSGLPDEFEQIQASFIEVRILAPTIVEVKGFVDAVDLGTKMLTINELEVDFNTALIDNNIPNLEPAVDQFIEVKGLATDFACGGVAKDTLIATKVELEPEGAGAISAGAHAEVEGFITEITLDGFKIGSSEVVTTSSTRYLPEDFSASDVVVGAKVEAEGTSTGGVLTATKISFRENVRLESDVVTGVTGTSPTYTFQLVGFPTITITTNSKTFSSLPAPPPSGHIRVRGVEGPGNTVLATRIDSQSGTDAFLQGPVDDVGGTEVTVLGTTIDTINIFQFEDVKEDPISRAEFLDLVQPGILVKFKSNLAAPTITWEEAELEDD